MESLRQCELCAGDLYLLYVCNNNTPQHACRLCSMCVHYIQNENNTLVSGDVCPSCYAQGALTVAPTEKTTLVCGAEVVLDGNERFYHELNCTTCLQQHNQTLFAECTLVHEHMLGQENVITAALQENALLEVQARYIITYNTELKQRVEGLIQERDLAHRTSIELWRRLLKSRARARARTAPPVQICGKRKRSALQG